MHRLVIPVLTFLLVAAAMLHQASAPAPHFDETPVVTMPELPMFRFEDGSPSEAELKTLPADTIIRRRTYFAPDGSTYVVSKVVGGRKKNSLHRPELCLPSQGFQMHSPHSLEVAGVPWRVIALERGVEPRIGFAYTFSNPDGVRTASHLKRIFLDVWDRSFNNRINRWVMTTVNASVTDDRRLERFLSLLVKGDCL